MSANPPAYLAADYLAAAQSLAPRGRVWPKEISATFTATLAGLAPTYERQNARANNLLVDAFPTTTLELLPDWESSLGLPDPCIGSQPTIQQRRDQVVARFIAGGGQSVAFFTAFALALGYPITITQYSPSRFGMLFGGVFGGDAWAHTWQVNAPSFTVQPFLFGADGFGEPFANWQNTVLQCEIQRLAPAHTVVVFNYS